MPWSGKSVLTIVLIMYTICYSLAECSHGDVNLIGGEDEFEGRVEVCIDGYWGTVCDDLWSYEDARVVCRQLDYPHSGAEALTFSFFGVGSGPINMDNVQCTGEEDQLINCTYLSTHNCVHLEDAGVRCSEAECNETDIRLVGGADKTEGRVEVCLSGKWGTVCDDFWGVTDARVACRHLGLPWEGTTTYNTPVVY